MKTLTIIETMSDADFEGMKKTELIKIIRRLNQELSDSREDMSHCLAFIYNYESQGCLCFESFGRELNYKMEHYNRDRQEKRKAT